MIFNDSTKFQSIEIPLNWAVDYNNNTYLTEYDFETNKRNDFYQIDTSKILRFGLFGLGMKFYYTQDGAFYINGRRIDLEYHLNDTVYPLSSSFNHKDCITYKQAYVVRNKNKIEQDSNIESINFGYKTLLNINGLQFYFQALICCPMEGKLHMEIKMTSNENSEGKLVFKSRNKEIESFNFPLEKNKSSNILWTIK